LQRAGRRNPMTHENAEDLTANVLVGRSVRHRSTIGFARHRSYGRTATVDKIAQPMGNLAFCRCPLSGAKRTWACALQMSANDPKRTSAVYLCPARLRYCHEANSADNSR
jgi:hypothetical protein